MLKEARPVNLDLRKFHFPITAICSIFHRVSGVVLFFFVPLALWLLDVSLNSSEGFDRVLHLFSYGCFRSVIWLALAALSYHLLAGLRHLLMDIGLGESLRAARCGAGLVLLFTLVLMIALGIWLW